VDNNNVQYCLIIIVCQGKSVDEVELLGQSGL